MTPKEKQDWTDTHTTSNQDIVTRAIIAELLASRTKIYQTPGLEGVSENGGSRINQKIQQILRKMSPAGMVEEEVKKLGKGKGNGSKGAPGGAGGKKRKIKDVGDEE
ncbi:hypothetical protein P7C73_g3396, partial [Tremellales sp. Uapishka_1]